MVSPDCTRTRTGTTSYRYRPFSVYLSSRELIFGLQEVSYLMQALPLSNLSSPLRVTVLTYLLTYLLKLVEVPTTE